MGSVERHGGERQQRPVVVHVVLLWRLLLVVSSITTVTVHSWTVRPVIRRPTARARWSASTSSNDDVEVQEVDVKSLLYQEHEKMLVERGKKEGELMAHFTAGLEANVVKGTGAGGGFASSNSNKKSPKQLKEEGKAHARVLREQGVVRIENVLPPDLADQVRAFVMELRAESKALVQSGAVKSQERFADVLLKEHRCDLTLPLTTSTGITAQALSAVLQQSAVGATIATLLGKDAVLYEFSCLISEPGSQRQVMHPDTPCAPTGENDDPVLYTCFVALQDITIDMGPTTWLPGTHTIEAHDIFANEALKDAQLQRGPAVLGLLPKGSCAIFDSRVLHCGGANTATANTKERAVFYCSFRNPAVANAGNPGSIRPNLIHQWTLATLDQELSKFQKDNNKNNKNKKKSLSSSSTTTTSTIFVSPN